jgi:hypothetical protein
MTNEKLQEIADNLDFGLRCFIHKDSADIRCFPDERQAYGFDEEPWEEDIKAVKKNQKQYIEIEKLTPQEEFGVMEAFARQVDQDLLRDKLLQILGRPKPFRNFKAELENAGSYRGKWLDFKNASMLESVKVQLQQKSNFLHE